MRGRPAPQGSKTPTRYGGFRESSKYLKPWREAVSSAAQEAVLGQEGFGIFDGPVRLEVLFFLQRPKSSKWGRFPAGPPDLSKLLRAVEDALTSAGVWVDDALVVDALVQKRWAGVGELLPEPGCFITIREL